jgi:phosphoadenosine phosphosulfate reductase
MIDFKPYLERIKTEIEVFQAAERKIFATTSCQTNSVVLLHILSELAPETPVYLLNTGFLFPETLSFRQQLADELGLDIRVLRSTLSLHQQKNSSGRFLFTSDPDLCCHLNKIAPLEPILHQFDLWINGVRATQSSTRASMGRTQPSQHGVTRYHPILDWDARMIYYYIEQNNLPRHPLEDAGYKSLGCQPCTRKWIDDLDSRGGRWQGLNKTECGLHTTLAQDEPS